jgi:hypothetical protein
VSLSRVENITIACGPEAAHTQLTQLAAIPNQVYKNPFR